MSEETKEQLLARIEELMSYGEEKETIDPSLLKYLDEASLSQIVEKIEKRRRNRIDEEKEWLAQFRKES